MNECAARGTRRFIRGKKRARREEWTEDRGEEIRGLTKSDLQAELLLAVEQVREAAPFKIGLSKMIY